MKYRNLGEMATFIMGQAPSSSDCNATGLGTPFVKAGEFGELRPIFREWTTKPLKHAKYGDVLICVVGATSGKLNLGADCAIGRSVAAIRPGAGLDQSYLFHLLKTKIAKLRSGSQGSAQGVITTGMLHEIQVPDIPLEEQKRIAAILDKADSLRRKRAQAIALADDFLRATFLDLFGDPVTNPKGWVVKPLIELVDPDRPITYGILMPGEDQEDGVKYVRVVDMKDGGIDTTSVKKTTQAISDSYRRSLLKKGDLVMSIRGHVGRVASTPSDLEGANITQDTARLAIVGVDPLYVKYFLRSPVMQYWMAQHTKGAAVKGINLTDVKRIPIQIPSPDFQAIFASQVQKIESYLKKSAIFHCDALTGFAALQNEFM